MHIGRCTKKTARHDEYTDQTPMLAMRLVSSAMPPARSLTVATKRHSRPSAARPRSRHRPRTVVSMLPPHSGITTLRRNTFSSVLPCTESPRDRSVGSKVKTLPASRKEKHVVVCDCGKKSLS